MHKPDIYEIERVFDCYVPIKHSIMSVKKNQHYVPQMQLRYFPVDESKKLVNIYHRATSKRIENVPISNQASEDYFYGIDGVLEDKLGEIESKISIILKNIICEKRLPKKNS